jgi:hypothetical protein
MRQLLKRNYDTIRRDMREAESEPTAGPSDEYGLVPKLFAIEPTLCGPSL